jgi:voltage-gated potassium channel
VNTSEQVSSMSGQVSSMSAQVRTLVLIGFVAVLIAGYAVVPTPSGGSKWLLLVSGAVGLLLYVGIALWAATQLGKSRRPLLDGVLLLIASASLVVLGFSLVYLGVAAADPGSFNQPLSKVSAAYFSMTILSTVGFGDIVGTTDTARAVVMAQMVMDVTLLTVAVQVVTRSARRAVDKKFNRTTDAEPS